MTVVKGDAITPRQRKLMKAAHELSEKHKLTPNEMASTGIWFVGHALLNVPPSDRAAFRDKTIKGLDEFMRMAVRMMAH